MSVCVRVCVCLSCAGSPVLGHLSWVNLFGLPVLGHLSLVACPGGFVLCYLFWVTCPGSSVLGHLSLVFCTWFLAGWVVLGSFLELPVLGQMSFVICPGPLVLIESSACVRACVRAGVRACGHACLRVCMFTYLPTYLFYLCVF